MNNYSIILNTVDGIDRDFTLTKDIYDFNTESTFSVGDTIFDCNGHSFKVIKICHYLEQEHDISGGTHPIEVYCVADTLTEADAKKLDDWSY